MPARNFFRVGYVRVVEIVEVCVVALALAHSFHASPQSLPLTLLIISIKDHLAEIGTRREYPERVAYKMAIRPLHAAFPIVLESNDKGVREQVG
jgi:hypothetical protein